MIILNTVFILVLVIFIISQFKKIRLNYHQTHFNGLLRKFPVPLVPLEDFDSIFNLNPEYGPGIQTEVQFIYRGPFYVLGGANDLETWILCVLAKKRLSIFEFGTCTGKTTYLLARNSPAQSKIVTLTLPNVNLDQICIQSQDTRNAINESKVSAFMYSGTDVEHKITQLFLDSRSLNVSEYVAQFDMIFIDGSHEYDCVKIDSENAFKMIRPDGIILWHDYRGPIETKGVYRYLNEIAKKYKLVRFPGTSLVAYRAV